MYKGYLTNLNGIRQRFESMSDINEDSASAVFDAASAGPREPCKLEEGVATWYCDTWLFVFFLAITNSRGVSHSQESTGS